MATMLPPGYLSAMPSFVTVRRSIRRNCQRGVVLRARAHLPAAVRLMRARDVRSHVRSLAHIRTHTRAYIYFAARHGFAPLLRGASLRLISYLVFA